MPEMRTVRTWPVLVVFACALVSGCGEAAAPGVIPAAKTSTAAQQSGAAPAAQAGSAVASASAQPATIADLFPAGAGRDAVLNNCGSCHNLACSTIGQRTVPRWDALRESHTERLPETDVAAAFAYLKAHFDDSKPEPTVPPKFLEGGCTPF
jgi:cytochrome c553